jgi:hypothetical protein
MVCEETLTEWRGVAVCEVCDWNENDPPVDQLVHGKRFDGTYGEALGSLEEQYGGRRAALMVDEDPGFDGGCEGRTCDGVSMCPECSAFFDEFGGMDNVPARCRHGLDEAQCVTCTGTRDPFASVRKNRPIRIAETGRIGTVRPDYANRIVSQLPMTVRGGFGIGQVRDVVPSTETAVRQWTDAPCDTEWASGADPDAPVYCQPKAKRGDTVPLWYRVTVRGATAPWPDPDAYDRGKYFAEIAAYCDDTPELPGPVEALIP